MKCTLIFYMAHQTGYCEMALTHCLEERAIAVESVQTAFSAQMLGELLNTSLRKTPLVFERRFVIVPGAGPHKRFAHRGANSCGGLYCGLQNVGSAVCC